MAVVHRKQYVTTGDDRRFDPETGVFTCNYSWTLRDVYQDVADARCWRCRRSTGALMAIVALCDETVPAKYIYHRACVPPVLFHQLAGRLPPRPDRVARVLWTGQRPTLAGSRPASGARADGVPQ